MAKLPQSTGGTGLQITELAPEGQHIAVCLRVNDQSQVERPTFENKAVKELTDVTRFVFGLVAQDGKMYIIQTYEFTISGAPGANLMKFLKQWIGRDPEIGWDYCAQLGTGAMITVQQKASKSKPGQSYANIAGIAPVHPQLAAHIPQAARFETLLKALEAAPMQNAKPPTQPGPSHPYPPYAQPPAQSLPSPPQAKCIFVHVNGQAIPMDMAALAHLASTGQGALPAIREGDTTWSTVQAMLPVAPVLPSPPSFPLPPPQTPAPPTFPPPPVGANFNEDVPF